MRKTALLVASAALGLLGAGCSDSSDRPGRGVPSEHPGVRFEGAGPVVTAEAVKEAVRNHVEAEGEKSGGFLALRDPAPGKTWRLSLATIHDPVRTFEKDGQRYYFACAGFRDLDTGATFDVDFWITARPDRLEVVETRIHKVDGVERYTYEGLHPVEIR